MFKRQRDRSIFFNLFSQISVLLVLIIVVSSYTLYDRLTTATYKTINTMNEKIVSQISYNFDFMDNYMKTFVMNQSQTSEINYLMNADSAEFADPYSLLDKFKAVNKVYMSTPFVDSMYVYNAKAEKIAVIGKNNGIGSRNDFHDPEIVELLYRGEELPLITPIARVIPASLSGPESNVYSYVYIDKGTSEYPNALVVNVNANWLLHNMNTLRDEQGSSDEFFLIVNKAGVVYGDSNNRQFLQNLQNTNYIQQVIQSSQYNAHFQLELDGKPFILTYSKLNDLSLSFISGIPVEKLVSFKSSLRNFTIILALLILLLGIGASYYMSKIMLSPLKLLEKKMRSLFSSGSTPKAVKNEIRFMSAALTDVADQMVQLQSFKANSMTILKNEYLCKWLTDPSFSEQPFDDSRFQFYNIDLQEGEPYRLLLFRIDRFAAYRQERSSGARDQTRVSMIQTIQEHLLRLGPCEAVDLQQDHFVMIVRADDDCTSELQKALHAMLDVVRVTHVLTLSVLISRVGKSLSEMSSLYQDSVTWSEYRMIKGHACIMKELELQRLPNRLEYEFPDEEMKALIRQLFVNIDLEGTRAHHERIAATLLQLTPANIRFAASYLLIMLLEKVKTITLTRNMAFDYDFAQMNHVLSECETLDDIDQFFLTFYTDVIGRLRSHQEGKNEDLVGKLKEYIHNQYKDPNLSVAHLSELLKLSPDYLRKTFKQSTGESIQNYINDVRLEKAAELLLSSNKVIEDIIRNVSIENTKYFYTLFKAKFGVTPAEYRLSQRKQQLIRPSGE